MKKLFISVLAIAGLVACNQEQTLVQQGPSPMEFGGAFVENATNTTRAAEDPSFKTATLEAFDVWAWMDNEDGMVLTDENVELVNGKWGYASTQYWAPDHAYFFDAVAPMDSENWKYDLTADENTIEFNNNALGTEDLLYATAKVETFGKSLTDEFAPVKLTFKHLLSKTKFTFKNGFPVDNVSIVVENIEMTSFKTATYNTVAKAWGEVSGEIVLAYGDVEETFSSDKNESTYERLTIPAVAKDYNVTYDVKVYQGENLAYSIEGKTATVAGITFEQGKAYNFVATITPENIVEGGLQPIEFEVEVEDWVYAGQDEGEIEEAELRAALQLGSEVTLQKDYTLTKSLVVPAGVRSTINLNGFDIINATNSEELGEGDGIVVYGDLTINGEGTVQGKTRSIWARGNNNPTVTINGGNYVGAVGGSECEVIYASGNGKITINGGTFQAETEDKVSFAAPQYAVLNIHGNGASGCDIVVYGGTFHKFNPADNISENPKKNFCAPGYSSSEVEEDVFVVSDSYVVVSAEGLQAALDAKVEEIRFAANIAGDVTINQQEGVNYAIDGAGFKFDGTMYINGHNRLDGEETLTIKNVAFETAATSKDFIWNADSQNSTVRYAHNITFDGCSFTAAEGTDVVGMRINQAYDVVVKNCVMNGGHSLAQITSSSDTVFESCTINAGRGLNLLTSCVGLVVSNCDITATKADGYGIRCDAGVASCLNLSGSTINAYEPVVLRKSTATFVFNVESTTLTAGGAYQIVVNGAKPVMNGAEGYTCNM